MGSGLFEKKHPTGVWYRDHSLSIVLLAIMAVQTIFLLWAGHTVWIGDQAAHGSNVAGWPSDFWIWWSWEYQVSLVADTYGVVLIVLLSKWLKETGSEESK